MTQLLTLPQAAKRLGISCKTLRGEIKAGRFPKPIRRNARWLRVPAQDVENFLKRLEQERHNPQPTEQL